MAATRKITSTTPPAVAAQQYKSMTAAQLRTKCQELQEKVDKFEGGGYCYMCDTHKSKDKFYLSTDPMIKSGITPICKECAKKIAFRVENGYEQEPTMESCQKALQYLNKPFIGTVWDASIQESENLLSGKVKSSVWAAYAKNIAMGQYNCMTYMDSDMFKVMPKPQKKKNKKSDKQIIKEHSGIDTYDSFLKNKADVVRLLNYDPFEKEDVADQPFLYSQLLGLLDSSEDANEDMMRTSSAISIVRGFLQQSKIDDTIAKLMSDIGNIEQNTATIKSLQESKAKITSVITNLAQDSCISLKYNKNAKKGENTWTGKIKKIKDLNLREGEVNGFDMETCKAMKQVMDLSHASILEMLHMDDSEWSDIVADQRTMITELQSQLDKYIEISRILLRENIDIKDYLNEQKVKLDFPTVNLSELYSRFAAAEAEERKFLNIDDEEAGDEEIIDFTEDNEPESEAVVDAV